MTIPNQPIPLPSGIHVAPPGSFLWWILRDSATLPADLASVAAAAHFPAAFLPPPVKPRKVTFRRALERAAANAPAPLGRWRVDFVDPQNAGRLRVPTGLKAWNDRSDPRLAVVEKWEPESFPEPWHVRLWIGMLSGNFKAFEILEDGKDVDVTAVATGKVSPAAPSGSEEMAQRIFKMLEEERIQATAPEIGDGVQKALEDVEGVKLRPGLYFLPGEAGIARAEATKAYLDAVGNTVAGVFTIH